MSVDTIERCEMYLTSGGARPIQNVVADDLERDRGDAAQDLHALRVEADGGGQREPAPRTRSTTGIGNHPADCESNRCAGTLGQRAAAAGDAGPADRAV